MGTEVEPA